MNNPCLKIFFIFFCAVVTACSSAKTINTFSPAAAKSDQAVVYIYRPVSMANAIHSPALMIDGEFKLYVKNSTNTRLSLQPGDHKFEFQPEKKYSALTPVSINLDAGKIYYIRVDTSLKLNSDQDYQPYERSFSLIRAEETQATKEIASCCLTNDKKSQAKKTTTPENKQTDEGFSVDKTQNPFSH